MNDKLFAEIIVDHKSVNTDKAFTYKVPDEYNKIIKRGMRVLISFGQGNKRVEGIVLNLNQQCNIEEKRLKDIDTILEEQPTLSEEMLQLGLWMRNKYLAKYIEVFRTMIPTGIMNKATKYIEMVEILDSKDLKKIMTSKQTRIMDYIAKNGKSEMQTISKDLKIKNILPSIRSLAQKGMIKVEDIIDANVMKKFEKVVIPNFDSQNISEILNQIEGRAHKQKSIIAFLEKVESISLKKLMMETVSSLSSVKSLADKGLIEISEQEIKRKPISDYRKRSKDKILTPDQKICLETIVEDLEKSRNNKFLIHGVTGSGKTEIYLQLIKTMIDSNKQTIVLVPEISLTPQTVERFVSRFGDRVAVLHSKLSLGERYDEWRRIKEGEVQIVVGARSAVFAPFSNLGLIIIDEEHETSYKSSMSPKYDTIEVSEKRIEIEGAALVLGTATPSIGTYYRAQKGEIKSLRLPERINKKPLPPIEIVDMREELDKGNKSILSGLLAESIEQNLMRKKQTILFLNRRGFSTFISCRKCGYVAKCRYCDISLTYHLTDNILKCHYCGSVEKPPSICPECGSKYIKYFGIGTQKVEEIIKKTFPNIRVIRMDVDTTTRKGSHERIFNRVKNGEVDVLIGTQMIAKGLDFPNVTLVGIIAADTTLNLPDYKASERTFQLVTQVSGRAGRGEIQGKVILQTYDPEHYSIKAAKGHDYVTFYNKEILLRETFNYPPFTNIINLVFSSSELKHLYSVAHSISNDITKRITKSQVDTSNIVFMGPNPAPLAKIKGNYRYQFIIKSMDNDIESLKGIIKDIYKINSQKDKYRDVKMSIDINPNSIM